MEWFINVNNNRGWTGMLTISGYIKSSLSWFLGLSMLANPGVLFDKQCDQEEIVEPQEVTYTEEVDTRIQTIATNIFKWKERYDNGFWWNCGVLLEADQKYPFATEIAKAVVVASDNYSTEDFWLDPDDLVLTLAIESRFDPCATGRGTRAFAYDEKLWTKIKNKNSHSKEELDKLAKYLDDEDISRNVDLGLAQILWPKYYNGSHKDMVDIYFNVDLAAQLMRGWAKQYGTDRPAILWKGLSDKNIEMRSETLRKFRYQFYRS